MAPFYGWGSSTSRLVPLRGHSLLFTTKFPDIPGTHRNQAFSIFEHVLSWVLNVMNIILVICQ